MGVVQAYGAIHQIHGNGDDDGRQHTGGKDEKEQVGLAGDLEPRESVGGYGAERDRQNGADHGDDQTVQESIGILGQLDAAAHPQQPFAAIIDALLVPGRAVVNAASTGLVSCTRLTRSLMNEVVSG